VNRSIFFLGSLDGLSTIFDDQSYREPTGEADVVVLPTAAAFIGAAEASVGVAEACEGIEARVEALMVTDRASANEAYFASRIVQADLVILCDGSVLHARSVWRNTLVGDAIAKASQLVALGSVSSLLSEVTIDPRGGAPTTGMGLCQGVTFCPPVNDDQLVRTRSLLGLDTALVVLGPRGVVHFGDEGWRALDGDDLVVTRGHDVTTL